MSLGHPAPEIKEESSDERSVLEEDVCLPIGSSAGQTIYITNDSNWFAALKLADDTNKLLHVLKV